MKSTSAGLLLIIGILLGIGSYGTLTATLMPDDYVWNSPSRNSSESMPLGGGDTGLNVWVENGAVYFYMSRSGAWDENNTLLKLGRVKVELQPNPFKDTSDFEQRLRLRDGSMEIKAGDVSLRLWVDVYKPVIHVQMQAKSRHQMLVSYESWRYTDRQLQKGESQQNSYKWAAPGGLEMRRDSMEVLDDKLFFYHHNPKETIFDITARQQGMEQQITTLYNPLAHLISGGMLSGGDLEFKNVSDGIYARQSFRSWNFSTKRAVRSSTFTIALHQQQSSEPSVWKDALLTSCKRISNKDQKATADWWKSFWGRSFVHATGDAATITRNYTLFRYMLGCNAFGTAPTRFNGGLFTFDPEYVDAKQAFTPDYRKWGGGTFTAQNQRLVYWPMLKSGDADLMKPQFEFYRRLLPTAEARSRTYWNHGGACFTEQTENFGMPNPSEYGWKRPESFDKGIEYNAWLEYQWETVLEFCQMILETNRYTGADISSYLPLIESSVFFFTEHYAYLASERGRRKLDGNNQLVIYPGSACETYKMAHNPVNTIAGLTRVLLTLKEVKTNHPEYTSGSLFSLHQTDSLLRLIPPMPVRELNGHAMIAPALSWERINNTEVPQLYPVFPWRFFNSRNDTLHHARNTWYHDPDVQKFRSHVGWKQDNIFAACLGLTAEAWELNTLKLGDGPHRFPAFWGPGFDWTPDHNHGGSGMIGLQEMLLQETESGELLLFPAWPMDKDVHFRLHASGGRVVEARLENGKVVLQQITNQGK